jgi:hypothetical protein
MRIICRSSLIVTVVVFAIVIGIFCWWSSSSTQDMEQVGEGDSMNSEGVTREQAIAIARPFFGGESNTFGCYFEERGDYYFVSPPYIFESDCERAGVYVNKSTGAAYKRKRWK